MGKSSLCCWSGDAAVAEATLGRVNSGGGRPSCELWRAVIGQTAQPGAARSEGKNGLYLRNFN